MSDAEVVNQEQLSGDIASPIELSFAPDDHHGIERSRRLRKSVFSALLTRPLAAVISFASIPLFTKYLGAERYGLYEAIIAFSIWLALSNAGITAGLVNKLTDCHVADDRLLARRYISSTWFGMFGFVILLCLIALVATPLIHWQWLFPAKSRLARAEVPWVVGVTILLTFVSLLAQIPASTYAAYQELDRNNYWDGASKVATLAACFAVVYTPFGLVGVALVMLAVPTFVRLLNTVYLFWIEKPWLRPSVALFDAKLLGKTFHEGISIFVLQMAAVGIFQSDKLIITKVLGSDANAGFSVILRLFLMAYGVYSLLLAPLWPAYGEASRRGDFRWIQRKLNQSLLLGCGIMSCCGAIMFFFGDPIVRRLSRGELPSASKPVIIGITAMFVVRVCTECQSILLNAAGILNPQMLVLGVNAVLNLIVGVIFARKFGLVGVAWSFPLTALLTSVWAYPWLIRRHFNSFLDRA